MLYDRIDDALAAAQRASQLDGNNKEVNMIVRRTKAVASARTKGNELFKGGKYGDASVAYGEGLEHDPHNSVLLCNRAACRSKLGQFEKALEDCNTALNVRPSFTKARLRKADCYFKVTFHFPYALIRIWCIDNVNISNADISYAYISYVSNYFLCSVLFSVLKITFI